MTPTAVTPSPTIHKKVCARVALVSLDEASVSVLHDCFRQFGIRTVVTGTEAADRLRREKFEACVVRLGDSSALRVLEAARTSASNSRIVIYGIAGSAQEALRFSKYGINAVLDPRSSARPRSRWCAPRICWWCTSSAVTCGCRSSPRCELRPGR